MRIKIKNLFIGWSIVTLCLTFCFISGIYQIKVMSFEIDIPECKVETELVGMPNVSVIEKEKIIEVEKENIVYNFPFDCEELGNFSVVGCVADTLPTKVYSNMRSVDGITVYASKDVLPEGSLIWIENIGIRQVQSLTNSFQDIYLYFDDITEATAFGVQDIAIYQINE